MQVSIETTTGLERKMTIGAPSDDIDTEYNERVQKASKTARIDGFRQGKVPLSVIKKRYGESIRQEVIGEFMSRLYAQAVSNEKLVPAGQPTIESYKDEPGEDFEFVAKFEVLPDVTVADLSTVKVARPESEVTDADVDNMIDALRKQSANWEEVDRAAQNGDEVTIDYNGIRDGEPFEGGEATDFLLELGTGRAIPGFEEGITGMKVGEEKVLPVTFPDDYHAEELRGADVEFTITLKSVTEAVLPPLDEAFFASYGLKQGGEEQFREIVRANMERDLKQALRTKTTARVMAQLADLHKDVELPDALVAREVTGMKEQMAQSMGGPNQSFDPNMLPDNLFIDQAQRRAIVSLIVNEIVKEQGIQMDEGKVRERVVEMASSYEKSEEVVNYYYSNREMLQGVEAAVLQEQVIDYILDQAQVTTEQLDYQKAIQPEQGDAADF